MLERGYQGESTWRLGERVGGSGDGPLFYHLFPWPHTPKLEPHSPSTGPTFRRPQAPDLTSIIVLLPPNLFPAPPLQVCAPLATLHCPQLLHPGPPHPIPSRET